jgi:hypothetical protein
MGFLLQELLKQVGKAVADEGRMSAGGGNQVAESQGTEHDRSRWCKRRKGLWLRLVMSDTWLLQEKTRLNRRRMLTCRRSEAACTCWLNVFLLH